MKKYFRRFLLLATAGMALSGCGGGGGSSRLVSTPPPPPTPTPTPTPTHAPVKIFAGVDESTSFSVLGIEASRPGADQTLISDGFAVRYDAAAGAYLITLPTYPSAQFYEYLGNTPNATWWAGYLVDEGTTPYGGGSLSQFSVLKPSNPELQLSYTTLASYDKSGMSPEPFGWLVFGMATPTGAVPVSGSATYSALVGGSSVDTNGHIGGTALLAFDFGTGKLSGHMDPVYYWLGGMGEGHELGRYTFANTVFGSGSANFSGQLSNPMFAQSGQFAGLFTGPAAQELMARWSAPFTDPITQQNSTMFGVWVGKKNGAN